MDLHDFGGVIWAIFIAIAVISSIVRSARNATRNAQTRQTPQVQRAQAPPLVIPSVASAASGVEGQRVAPSAAQTRQAPRVVRIQPSRAPAPIVIPSPSTPPPSAATLRTGSARSAESRDRFRAASIFERGSPLARGIVALEILGPPRSMRDWTPLA
jgi:hypothetical protein